MSEYGNRIIEYEDEEAKKPMPGLSDLITRNFLKKNPELPQIKTLLAAKKEKLLAIPNEEKHILPTNTSAEQKR
jgi:hypothetical protein